MPVEVLAVQENAIAEFLRAHEREGLATLYGFTTIWHEQRHDFAATEDGRTLGVASLAIAASLAHVLRVIVVPQRRGHGIGRALLEEAAARSNYYNCHKMSALVPHGGSAQRFLERCGYREEAVLRQHTFKLDMAMMRRFLL